MGWGATLLLKLALLLAPSTLAAPAAADCLSKCGNVDISYPFGTTEGCFKDDDFQIICDDSSSGHPIPYLARERKDIEDHNIEVLKISESTSEIQVSMPAYYVCYDPKRDSYWKRDDFSVPSKFGISNKKNEFIVVGCNAYAFLYDWKGKRLNGCDSKCGDQTSETNNNGSFSGAGSCRSDLEQSVTNYTITIVFYDSPDVDLRCGYAFLAQNRSFSFSDEDDLIKLLRESNRSSVVLDWTVDNTSSCGGACKGHNSKCTESESASGYYYCKCKPGFEGNPYRDDGCKDVNECLDSNLNKCLHQKLCRNTDGDYKCSCPRGQRGNGRTEGSGSGCSPIISVPLVVTTALLVVFTLGFISYWVCKQRDLRKQRQNNFKQNGGDLLQQLLSQQQRDTDKARIFKEVELENATDNFNESNILGSGGQGDVYKGTLPDGRYVAIKKSRVEGKEHIRSFINEVAMLSQINHRHVVKLLGCCLETQVPSLVYEYVSNGNLLERLEKSTNKWSISWETRLKIAAETAQAISYLHCNASHPIIHRDIKLSNVLLEHNDNVKVCNFGLSRLVRPDEFQVSTNIRGTHGYLDPQYLKTRKLTEKSDVYSFGIVLVELLTGKKVSTFDDQLAENFVSLMKEDGLPEILETQLPRLEKNAEAQIKEVARLAEKCIKADREERPTMEEVANELQGLMAMEQHLGGRNKGEEGEGLLSHRPDDRYGSTSASFEVTNQQAVFEIEVGR